MKRAMKVLHARFRMVCLVAATSATPCAHGQAVRFPITSLHVAEVLSSRGLATTPEHVEVPEGLSALRARPQLRLESLEPLPDGRLRARMACQQMADCTPFLATVRLPATGERVATTTGSTQGGSFGPVQKEPSGQRLMAGQKATLFLETPRMRITLPVVAVDSGAPGAKIRVSSPDHRQTYRAVVVNTNSVQGELP